MQQSQLKYYLYGTLVSPLLMLFVAFKQFHTQDARKYIWIYSGLFGFFILLPEEYDGFRHAMNVENHYSGLPFYQFLEEAWQLILLNPSEKTNDDIFLHIISYVAAFFGSGRGVFFLIVSLIYSFFYIKVLGLVYDMLPKQKSLFIFMLFGLLIIWKSFEGINAVRSWTGAWIFLYGLLNYLNTKERRYFLFILLTPFVHFAFFVFSLSFWAYYFIGNKPKIYFSIVILSTIFSVTIGKTEFVRNLASLTSLGEEKMNVYAIEDENRLERITEKIAIKKESNSFHKVYYPVLTNNLTIILLLFLVFRLGYLRGNVRDQLVFGTISVALCLLSIVNFLGGIIIPIHNRGMIILGMMTLSVAIIAFSQMQLKAELYPSNFFQIFLTPIKGFTVIVFALAFYHKILAISAMSNVLLLYSPLTFFMFETPVSIRELLGYMF